MSVERIDYVYVETHDWARSKEFWTSLGLHLAMDLEGAGRFEPTDGGPGIFVEEVPAEQPLGSAIYLRFGPGDLTLDADTVVEDFAPSHWGTRLATVRDPDGRTFILQQQGSDSAGDG